MSSQGVVAIIGLGLIGGSLALALKQCTNYAVHGYDSSPAVLGQAVSLGALDKASANIQEAVCEADIVVFCLPVKQISIAVAEGAASFKEGAVVTDVGSIKGALLTVIPSLLPRGVSYVGGHPMAGSEKSGFNAASPNLFVDRPYILTTDSDINYRAVEKLKNMITNIGAVPIVMNGSSHDTVAAQISHMPHIVAAALVTLANRSKHHTLNLSLAAGGFRDMTRIASANPAMWVDICLTNREEIINSILELQKMLNSIAAILKQEDIGNLTAFFTEAKNIRDGMFIKDTQFAEAE